MLIFTLLPAVAVVSVALPSVSNASAATVTEVAAIVRLPPKVMGETPDISAPSMSTNVTEVTSDKFTPLITKVPLRWKLLLANAVPPKVVMMGPAVPVLVVTILGVVVD